MTLVGYWPLYESSGTTVNDVAGGNDGTNNGATQGASGILGSTAYQFDSSNTEYVQVDDTSFTEDGVSYAAWIRLSDAGMGTPRTITTEQPSSDSDDYRNLFRVTDTDVLNVDSFEDDGGGAITGNKVLSSLVWYHVVITIQSDSTTTFYINGVEDVTGTMEGYTGNTPLDTFGIGARPLSETVLFDGKISEVRAYSRSLTPAEVQLLYQTGQNSQFVSQKKTL